MGWELKLPPKVKHRCPDCRGQMVRRKNKASGTEFFGCATFPKCRGTRELDGEAPWDREIASGGDHDFWQDYFDAAAMGADGWGGD